MNTLKQSEHDIDITVKTMYIAEQSDPESNEFAFAYTITITNQGEQPAKLLRRYWKITDANEKVHEVSGEGVVGETPLVKPGESFTYTSGTLLGTEFGFMKGSYQMINTDGLLFNAEIPAFTLARPNALH